MQCTQPGVEQEISGQRSDKEDRAAERNADHGRGRSGMRTPKLIQAQEIEYNHKEESYRSVGGRRCSLLRAKQRSATAVMQSREGGRGEEERGSGVMTRTRIQESDSRGESSGRKHQGGERRVIDEIRPA